MFSKKLQKNIDRLIKDLYLKPKICQAFKEDPEKVGLQYGVSKEAIEAIKTGDWKELLEMGMNPKLLEDPAYKLIDKVKIRFLRFAFSTLIIIFGVFASFLAFPARARAWRAKIEPRKMARRKVLPRTEIRTKLARRVSRKIGTLARSYQRLEKRKANIFARMKRKENVLNRRLLDHIGNFNFKVEIDRVKAGAFKNIKFLDPIEEYKDEDDIGIIFGKGNDVNVEEIDKPSPKLWLLTFDGKGNDVNVEEIFRNVEGLDSEIEVIEYQDGDDIVLGKRPGRTKYSNIFGKGNDVNVEGIEIPVEKIERSAKAAKNEQFRHNIVMNLIQKMPDGRF